MKHARVAFVLAIMLNLTWIAWGMFQPIGTEARTAALLMVGPSIASLVIYQLYLGSRGQFLTQRDIDSVYYLGFLITLMVLAAAAYQVTAYDGPQGEGGQKLIAAVGLKFALGLLATGVGLFGRINLQSKLLAPDDATKAIEDYVDGIGRLNDRINTSTLEIERLVGEVLKSASQTSRDASAAVMATLSEELEPTARRLSDAIGQLNVVAEAIGSGPLKDLGEVTEELSTGFDALGQKIPVVNERLSSLASFAMEAATAQSDLAQAALSTTESVKGAEQAIAAAGHAVTPVGPQINELAESIRKANTVLRKTPDAAAKLDVGLQSAADSVQKLGGTTAQLVEAIAVYQKALDASPIQEFERSLANAMSSAGQLSRAMSGLSSSVTTIGNQFSTDIGPSVVTIRELAVGMSETSEQLGRAMVSLATAIRNAADQVAR